MPEKTAGHTPNELSLENDTSKYTQTVLAIALDFDLVTNDPMKSRADEIKLLTIKNRKQAKKNKEKKPPGVGCPAGGVESCEELERAVIRETRDESGYGSSGAKILGKIYVEHRHKISNSIHVHLIKVDSLYVIKVKESDEVYPTWDNWLTLRQVLKMPYAIGRDGRPENPDGIYFSHVRRLIKALNILVLSSPENLPKDASNWIDEHYRDLASAMKDLLRDGLVVLRDDGQIGLPNKDKSDK